jgi:hypothetical protein
MGKLKKLGDKLLQCCSVRHESETKSTSEMSRGSAVGRQRLTPLARFVLNN